MTFLRKIQLFALLKLIHATWNLLCHSDHLSTNTGNKSPKRIFKHEFPSSTVGSQWSAPSTELLSHISWNATQNVFSILNGHSDFDLAVRFWLLRFSGFQFLHLKMEITTHLPYSKEKRNLPSSRIYLKFINKMFSTKINITTYFFLPCPWLWLKLVGSETVVFFSQNNI